MVSRLRQTVERSLYALLVSRRAQRNSQGCAELRGILALWDGQFTVPMRKRISRHIESCAVCDEERRRLVSPTALLGAAPVMIPAPRWLRDKTMRDIELVSHDTAMAGGADRSAGGHGARADRRRMMLAALLIAELAAATALLIAYINSSSATPVSPAEVSQTATPDPPSAPPPPLPPPPPAPSPRDEPTPRSAPPPQPPPSIVVVPPPAPEADVPPAEEPPATPAAPSTKPPMSFSPTAVVTPAPPPDSDGGGNRRSSRAGAS